MVSGALLVLLGFIPLPGTRTVTVALTPPEACRACHADVGTPAAYETWLGSPMAHAVQDPAFLAALDVAERDYRGIGDLCLRCHAPEAWLQTRCTPPNGARLLPTDTGVTCSACHRMLPNPYVRDGQYIVAQDDVMRGPYGAPIREHLTAQSDFISSAELCGTCHNLVNPLMPRRDPASGAPMGLSFSEQTTYFEWAASSYAGPGGRTCIDCHMKVDTGPIAVGSAPRTDRSSHTWVGSNVFLLDYVADHATSAELIAAIDAARAATRTALREAASLELQGDPPRARRGERLSFTVRVTNLTGHKLPTGYPEQQVYVSLDADALAVHRGQLDPVQRDVIDPVARYRTVQGQHDVGPSGRLALADTVFSDNRIPPLGMVVTPTIAPVGYTFEEVAPGVLAHWDDVAVTLDVPCELAVSSFEVRMGLHHLSLPGHYIDFLSGELPPPSLRGGMLRDAWQRAPAAPEEMAALRFTVSVSPTACVPTDAGASEVGLDAAPSADAAAADAEGAAMDAAAGVDAVSAADARASDAAEVPADGEGCSCDVARFDRGVAYLAAALLLLSGGARRAVRRGSARASVASAGPPAP